MSREGRRVLGLVTLVLAAAGLAFPDPGSLRGPAPCVTRVRPLETFLHDRGTARYRVEANDTLSHIALRYGLSRADVLRANPRLQARPHQLEIHDIVELPLTSRR